MNAFEIPGLRFSLVAGAAVNRYRFVTCAADGDGEQASGAVQIIGASYNEAASGEVLEICDGIVTVEAGAAVAAGAQVEADANGKAITYVDGPSGGTALTSAAADGDLITVKI